MNIKSDGVQGNQPKPPVKKPHPVEKSKQVSSTIKPRGIKAWLIRFIDRVIKKLSKFR